MEAAMMSAVDEMKAMVATHAASLAQLLAKQAAAEDAAQAAEENSEAPASTAAAASGSTAVAGFDENDPSTWGTPARNDECPCGSGKKFKQCHGKLA